MTPTSRLLLASTFAVCTVSAHAQAASAPTAIGESASTAARAQAKAASDPDVGSVVRTGPTAAHDAKRAAHHAEGSASSSAHKHVHHAHVAASAASN